MLKIINLLSMLAGIMYAAPDGGGISPETIERMPADTRNPSGPVGRDWHQHGQHIGQTVIAAEQGIVVAEQSLVSVRLNGLGEICTLDDTGRAQFIGGVQNAFATVDGDKLGKAHQNYLTDLRRISAAMKSGSESKALISLLEGKGTYAEKMAKVPRASASGGANKGGGQAAVVAQAIEAVKAAGAENVVISTKADAPQEQENQPAAGLSAPPPTVAQQRTAQHAESTLEEITSKLQFLHENQIEGAAWALSRRCDQSPSPLYQELGKMIAKVLQAGEQREELPAAKAA